MELNINKILAQKGMRKAELAAKLNVDQSNLKRSWENNPKLSRLVDIANALGVSIRDLFPDSPPSLSEGMLRVGDRHFALIPVDAPDNPFIFNSDNFYPAVEAFILRCIKYSKTISFCGMYNEKYPFALINDAQSRRLFVSFAPVAEDYRTIVYEPHKDNIAHALVSDENVAKTIALNIISDIEEILREQSDQSKVTQG